MSDVKKSETINVAVPKRTHAILIAEKKKTKAPLYKVLADFISDGKKFRSLSR